MPGIDLYISRESCRRPVKMGSGPHNVGLFDELGAVYPSLGCALIDQSI